MFSGNDLGISLVTSHLYSLKSQSSTYWHLAMGSSQLLREGRKSGKDFLQLPAVAQPKPEREPALSIVQPTSPYKKMQMLYF